MQHYRFLARVYILAQRLLTNKPKDVIASNLIYIQKVYDRSFIPT